MTLDELVRGVRRIRKRLDQVIAFDPNSLDQANPYGTVRPLEADIETALSETFGHGTTDYIRFSAAKSFHWPIRLGGETRHSEKVRHVAQDRQRSIQLLEAAISLLEERIADSEDVGVTADMPAVEAPRSRRVFIVHGHDNEPKEAVARFVKAIGFDPIILHERANKGRTIIQKFQEEASDVGFAIVLMSPDDAMADGSVRARQNVILELGFFLGALGPDRVAAVVKGPVETPSDFEGVLYIPFDPGWKAAVSKELEAAGYPIDWNIVMRQ